MRQKRKQKIRPQRPLREFGLELEFDRAARRLSVTTRADLLRWLLKPRRRPARLFFVMTPTGEWRILT